MTEQIQHLLGGIIGLIIAFLIVKLIDNLCKSPYLSVAEQKEIDAQCCQEMRNTGWDEHQVRDFMRRNNCHYDKDHE